MHGHRCRGRNCSCRRAAPQRRDSGGARGRVRTKGWSLFRAGSTRSSGLENLKWGWAPPKRSPAPPHLKKKRKTRTSSGLKIHIEKVPAHRLAARSSCRPGSGELGHAAADYTQLGWDGSEPSALTSARLRPRRGEIGSAAGRGRGANHSQMALIAEIKTDGAAGNKFVIRALPSDHQSGPTAGRIGRECACVYSGGVGSGERRGRAPAPGLAWAG